MTVRIAKFLSDSGIASRRGAEDMISHGRVAINGRVIDSPVEFVDDTDVVTVDGVTVRPRVATKLYVGRLDFKTTGLLLLTNDGELARRLTLPSSHIAREYIATVNKIDNAGLCRARAGITVDGISYRPMEIEIMDANNLRVRVTEGKKNEVRIVLRSCGCPVRKLHRVSFGTIKLGNLSVGKIREESQKTIDALIKTL